MMDDACDIDDEFMMDDDEVGDELVDYCGEDYHDGGGNVIMRHKTGNLSCVDSRIDVGVESCFKGWKTSDAGSQYRCGWVGRVIQPPSTSQLPPHTQTHTKSIQNTLFSTF